MTDALQLTVYFGERARADGGFLADAVMRVFARHALQAGIVLRGMEGFGAHQLLRSDRLLSLSEDLPVVAIAVDASAKIESALAELKALEFSGLLTLERARLLTAPPPALDGASKLTVYVGRHERIGQRPAHEAVVAALHRHGVAGATVLLGVDGTVHGRRERARLFARNSRVPLMIIAVDEGPALAAAADELAGLLARPLMTLERARVCKRDGATLSGPPQVAEHDSAGLALWQKLTVYTGEQARHDGQPIARGLVRELRAAGAPGATTVRGIWGYHGDHAPHGDTFWQLRRRVPVMTVIVDRPQRMRRWYEIADAMTRRTGLITSEIVPAYRASAPSFERGGLRLAHRMP